MVYATKFTAINRYVPCIFDTVWHRSRNRCFFVEHGRQRYLQGLRIVNGDRLRVGLTINRERDSLHTAGTPGHIIRSETIAFRHTAVESPCRRTRGLCPTIGNEHLFIRTSEGRHLNRVAYHIRDDGLREDRQFILAVERLNGYLVVTVRKIGGRNQITRAFRIVIIRNEGCVIIAAVLRADEIGGRSLLFHTQVITHICRRRMVINRRRPCDKQTFVGHRSLYIGRCRRTYIGLRYNRVKRTADPQIVVIRREVTVSEVTAVCFREQESFSNHIVRLFIPSIYTRSTFTFSRIANTCHGIEITVIIKIRQHVLEVIERRILLLSLREETLQLRIIHAHGQTIIHCIVRQVPIAVIGTCIVMVILTEQHIHMAVFVPIVPEDIVVQRV